MTTERTYLRVGGEVFPEELFFALVNLCAGCTSPGS